jgi:SET domain-containing protein
MEHLYVVINGDKKKVHAKKNFKRDDLLLEFGGEVIHTTQLPENHHQERYIQIDHEKYLAPSGDLDDHINHSCDPNSGIVIRDDRVFLITIKPVKQDEEITWDYSTAINNDKFEIECICQTESCRKKIISFKDLPEGIQERYIELGIVPDHARG